MLILKHFPQDGPRKSFLWNILRAGSSFSIFWECCWLQVIDSRDLVMIFFALDLDQIACEALASQLLILMANPTSGGVTASTEMLAAKRHAGVHTPVIACKMIIANQQMAYAA